MKKYLLLFSALFIFASSVLAVSPYIPIQGGTGTTTPSGILYGDNGATTHLNTVTIGTNLTFSGGTLSATGGSAVSDWQVITGLYNAPVITSTTSLPFYVPNQGTSTIANLGGILDVSAFVGADIGAKIGAAYTACPLKSCILFVPRGLYSFSTVINFNTNGKRAILTGTAGGGTELIYTGSGVAITENWGIQATGINHTSGCGVQNITLTGTGYLGTGLYVGGTNGTDCSEDRNVNIQGFAIGWQLGANAYHYNNYNSAIRDNTQNMVLNAASNSGENINFYGLLMSDCANHGVTDCIWFDNSATENTTFHGGQINDGEVHIKQANNVTFLGTDFENVGSKSGGWPAYTFITIDNNIATNVVCSGCVFFNTATTGFSPTTFISNGGNLTLTGVIVRAFNVDTVDQFVTLTGSGRVTWTGFNKVNNAITNVTGTSLAPVNGTTGSSTIPSIVTNSSGGLLTLKNFNSGGYTAIDFINNLGLTKGGIGVGNSAVGGIYQDNFYISAPTFSSNVTFPNALNTETARFTGTGYVGIGTTTPQYLTTIASSTVPQLSLSTGAGISQWTMRNAGGMFYLSTTTIAGTATSSIAALTIDTNGKVIANCFSNNGSTCISGSSSFTGAASSVVTTDSSGNLIATGTQLTVGNLLATSTTATSTFMGAVGIGTTYPKQVNTNSWLTLASIGATDGVASTTDNTTLSTAIWEAYAPGSRVFIGAHGTNQVTTQYGITVGGWGELGAINSSFNTSNGLLIGTRTTNTPIVFGTNSVERMRILGAGNIAIGTTTASLLSSVVIASSTNPQLALSAGANLAQWAFRNAGGNFYLGTTTVAGTATTSISALEISGSGFGTTTLRGLNIAGFATSTSNVGFNITTGCYAVNGTCLGSGSGSGTVSTGGPNMLAFYSANGTTIVATSSNPLYVDAITASSTSANNIFLGDILQGTTTNPLSAQVIAFNATVPQLSLSSGANIAQWTMRNAGGNLYFSTTTVAGTATTSTAAMTLNNTGTGMWISTSTSLATGLGVEGTIFFGSLTTAAGTPSSICMNAATKEITVNAALTCTVSSRTQKNDEGYLKGDYLSTVMLLQPVQFAYKDQPNRSRWGFYAEDVATVNRKLGDGYDENGKPQSLDQNAILAVTVKAVQELAKAKGLVRNAEENWQTYGLIIAFLLIGLQQLQIRKLRK